MENHKLTWEIRNYVDVNRKAHDIEEITAQTVFNDLPQNIQQILNTLPKINGNEYFTDPSEGFFAHVLDGEQQLYLMEMDGRLFFIDTQGYQYARYVGELI